jgi:hypothetical protein
MKIQGQRNLSFIVVWIILIFACGSTAQTQGLMGNKGLPAGVEWKAAKPPISLVQGQSAQASSYFETGRAPAPFFKALFIPQKMPGADYYTRHMGFFCKKEWEFEKTAHLPLRFRLGSLENCNYLEGKNR